LPAAQTGNQILRHRDSSMPAVAGVRCKPLMHNDIRRHRRACHASTISPIAGQRQLSNGRDPCMVMIFQPLPMDPNIGLLTIERFDLPALGVS
jgi:hypothetical protein